MINENVIIDEIKKIREKNNSLWMEILRIALKNTPDQTRDVLQKINKNDRKISGLLKELG